MTQTFTVLVVCTGNVCRSPMAQEMLRHKLADRLGERASAIRVVSAGTGALEDAPMTEYAAAVLSEHGVPPEGVEAFRGRQLEPEHITSADLILTATREHRAAVATLMPDAAGRTFTIAEFALLVREVDAAQLPTDPVERARAVTEAALGLRGTVLPPSPQALDLADPYALPLDVFRDVGKQLDEALTAVAEAIAANGR